MGRKARFRIEFLDGSNTVVREMHVFASSPADAFLLVVHTEWPPHALTARVIDPKERRRLTVSKPEAEERRRKHK